MPVPIIILTVLVFGLRILLGDYAVVKPSIFVGVISMAAVCLVLICLKNDIRKSIQAQVMTIAVALPLLAWSIPNSGLLLLLMCFFVPAAAGRFSLIVPVYLFSLLLLPSLDGLMMLGSLKLIDFGVHDAMAIGAATAIFINQAKAKCRIEWDIIVIAVAIVIAMALARETSFSHHLRALAEILLDLGLPYYIVSRGMRTGDELKSAMLWLGIAGVLVAAILIFEVWKAWPIYNELYRVHENPTLLVVKMRAGLLRASGPFVEPTSMAMLLGLCIVALYQSREYFLSRPHYLLLLCVTAIGLIAPQSRSAWIGAGTAILAIDMMSRRYTQLAGKVLAGGGLLCGLFLAAQFSSSLSETLGLSGGSSATTEYRRLLLERGLEEFLKSPLIGHSPRNLQFLLADLMQGEGIIDFVNTYLWIMLLSGTVGLIVFCTPIFYFLSSTLRLVRSRGPEQGNVLAGAFVFGSLLMFTEMFFFTSFGTRPAIFQFVLFGFAAAFIRIQQREKAVALEEHEHEHAPSPLLAVGGAHHELP